MKRLFLTFAVAAMAFTACKKSDNNEPEPDLDLRIVAESVGGRNISTVKIVVAETDYGDQIARASYLGGGFSMTLPVTLPAEVLRALGLISTDITYDEISVSDPSAMYFVAGFTGYDGEESVGWLENQSTYGTPTIEYWYVDRDVAISGISTDGSTTYNTKLSQGWNRVLINMDIDGTSFTSPVPPQTKPGWIFHSYM